MKETLREPLSVGETLAVTEPDSVLAAEGDTVELKLGVRELLGHEEGAVSWALPVTLTLPVEDGEDNKVGVEEGHCVGEPLCEALSEGWLELVAAPVAVPSVEKDKVPVAQAVMEPQGDGDALCRVLLVSLPLPEEEGDPRAVGVAEGH